MKAEDEGAEPYDLGAHNEAAIRNAPPLTPQQIANIRRIMLSGSGKANGGPDVA